jgi:hypothetical protein
MDSAAVEATGIKPLRRELAQINAIQDRRGVQTAIAWLHGVGISASFVFRSVPDAKKSARTIAEVYQSGLGLPHREYYLRRAPLTRKSGESTSLMSPRCSGSRVSIKPRPDGRRSRDYRRFLEGKPEPAPIDGLTGPQRFLLAGRRSGS